MPKYNEMYRAWRREQQVGQDADTQVDGINFDGADQPLLENAAVAADSAEVGNEEDLDGESQVASQMPAGFLSHISSLTPEAVFSAAASAAVAATSVPSPATSGKGGSGGRSGKGGKGGTAAMDAGHKGGKGGSASARATPYGPHQDLADGQPLAMMCMLGQDSQQP